MEYKKKIIAFIQARGESERFPKKIFYKINKKYLIEILIERLKKSKLISKIAILTYKSDLNNNLVQIAKKLKCELFFGSKDDVLKRFYTASKKFKKFNQIVRITGDCTLVDPKLVDQVILYHLNSNFDYTSNVNPSSFPDGLDVEIFKKKILNDTFKVAKKKFDKEHVTPLMTRNKKYKIGNFKLKKNFSDFKISVDEYEDYIKLERLLKDNNYNIHINFKEILDYLKRNRKKFKTFFKYNTGSKLLKGQKLWIRSKNIIAGGNMFFSKNPDNFLPKLWPAYFSKSKKCFLWDLNNKKYTDICLMGVGTNILGYANSKIDKKVKQVIQKGNMTTLNCPEEVDFSEKILELNPWADKVKLARTGGELNSMAIRIARAATNKTKIAICGYHGWHDWYLAANLKNKNNLNNHLFKGLKARGIPNELRNTIFTFDYGNFKKIESIANNNRLAAIKLEVTRNDSASLSFLKKIRALAIKKNIVLIFDECTSGFRETFGGIHKKYNIYPDIALYGKSIGNGYPITAMTGKNSIMEHSKSTFMSSTFWSDRIGPTAGLATLKEMQRIKSWEIISDIGKKIKKEWKKISLLNKLDIHVQGISSLPNFYFKNRKNLIYKTFITQEMLKRNILANMAVYVCIDHNEKILDTYFDNLNDIFNIISKNNSNEELLQLLDKMVIDDFKKNNIII